MLLTRLDPELPVPTYARHGDAGVDLRTVADVRLEPGQRALVGTGVAIALPDGYAGFVHPRSGLAARAGLSIVNAPGTVDAGYRGEIRVCLVNHDPREAVELRRGDRIAQLVVQRVERVRFVEVADLPPSERGAGGHGSTGGHARLAPVEDVEDAPPGDVLGGVPGDPMDAQAVPMDLAAGAAARSGGGER
nr:dUTP diphosphatase [Pseudonocardia lacus]